MSGGRFTPGIGLGGRPDDFVVEDLGPRGTGKRLDQDLEIYKSAWRGETPPGCENPVVPHGSREVPLLFGDMVPGRTGSAYLVAIAYYAFGNVEAGRASVRDYYSSAGADLADFLASGVSGGAEAVRATVQAFAEIGADELVFNPTSDDINKVARLAEVVL